MTKAAMTDEHKAALARGRTQSRAVRAYLAALESDRSRKGRRSPEKIEGRLTAIVAEMNTVTPIKKLQLIQERLDLQAELERLTGGDDEAGFETAEAAFLEHAADYAKAKGISYVAWREMGVDAKVLRAAGISR